MELQWNYDYTSYLTVATQWQSEMTSYLNNSYDVMNFSAKFEKFLPYSIIMTSWPGGAPLPPPPKKS